jgi:hypothetical protein
MNFRVLGPHEQGRFEPEAWGRLLSLHGSGAISAVDLEAIIERALCQDARIALDDLRVLLAISGYPEPEESGGEERVH